MKTAGQDHTPVTPGAEPSLQICKKISGGSWSKSPIMTTTNPPNSVVYQQQFLHQLFCICNCFFLKRQLFFSQQQH
jgi:hypothetical protein